MSLLLGTEKDGAVFTVLFPPVYFQPSIVEFFIVMVAASSDVTLVCVGSAFSFYCWLQT